METLWPSFDERPIAPYFTASCESKRLDGKRSLIRVAVSKEGYADSPRGVKVFYVLFKEISEDTVGWTIVDTPTHEAWKDPKQRRKPQVSSNAKQKQQPKLEPSFTAEVDAVKETEQITWLGVTVEGERTKQGTAYGCIVMLQCTHKGNVEVIYGPVDTCVVSNATKRR